MTMTNALRRMNSVEVNEPLTYREMEVIELVAIGMSNSEIALAMCLSENTIASHVVALHQKLNLLREGGGNLRVLIALYAIRAGFVVPA